MKRWTFEIDGQVFDGDFSRRADAYFYAQDQFVEQCEAEGLKHDHEVWVDLILFDAEKNKEIKREQAALFFEYYHGDITEHGTWSQPISI